MRLIDGEILEDVFTKIANLTGGAQKRNLFLLQGWSIKCPQKMPCRWCGSESASITTPTSTVFSPAPNPGPCSAQRRTTIAAGASAETNLPVAAIWMEVEPMPPDRRRDLADGLLILLAVIMLLVVFCAAWSHYDRLGWVRFVSALPFPGWVKSILWGWA